jgi:hypothetical protein
MSSAACVAIKCIRAVDKDRVPKFLVRGVPDVEVQAWREAKCSLGCTREITAALPQQHVAANELICT